jgi:diguanylate cyclase (GGDEF)-like protein
MAMLTAITAEEFWCGRSEALMSRWPTVCALLAYAAVLLARIPATLLSPILSGRSLMSGVSFALLAFGTLLFTVVLAFLLLNMAKERSELKHKIASLIDPLSGVPNRRAFIDGAERLLLQQNLDFEPLAVFLFDLDRFKLINDRLGHGTGDVVLQLFATTATRTLGSDVLFGRIGGEEFAAVLAVGDLGEAEAIADRVRRNFETAAEGHGDDELRASVSVGVALGCDPQAAVAELLSSADEALYRAKANGRNRVETSPPVMGERTPNQEPSTDGTERRRWRAAAAPA